MSRWPDSCAQAVWRFDGRPKLPMPASGKAASGASKGVEVSEPLILSAECEKISTSTSFSHYVIGM
jgi:hypothetical protein